MSNNEKSITYFDTVIPEVCEILTSNNIEYINNDDLELVIDLTDTITRDFIDKLIINNISIPKTILIVLISIRCINDKIYIRKNRGY